MRSTPPPARKPAERAEPKPENVVVEGFDELVGVVLLIAVVLGLCWMAPERAFELLLRVGLRVALSR